MAAPRAAQNRKLRQDNLREWLSEKCTAQHLIENIIKIEGLDPDSESFQNKLNKLKVANEQRIKVMNKYLPDLKAVELTGENGESIKVDNTWKVEFLNADSESQS